MADPLTRPKSSYRQMPEDDRLLADKLIDVLLTRARIPTFERLKPEAAKQTAIGLLDLGLLKVCREGEKAWLELHNGKVYVRV